MPPRIAHILRRALEGPLDDAERAELSAWAGAPVGPVDDATFAPVAGALRAALAELPPVEVSGPVLAALDEDAAFAPARDELRAALTALSPVDVADDVFAALQLEESFAGTGASLRDSVSADFDLGDDFFAALPDARTESDAAAMEISAFGDGEVADARRPELARRLLRDPAARAALSAQAELGAAVREAARSEVVDVWADVARAIGVRDEEAEFAPVGAALREAVQGPRVDVSAEVMAAVAPRARELPRWASFGGPVLVFAAAAAMLFSLLPAVQAPPTEQLAVFELASVNDAQVEDMLYAEGVTGVVIPPEAAGDVMVIVVDDSALAASGGAQL